MAGEVLVLACPAGGAEVLTGARGWGLVKEATTLMADGAVFDEDLFVEALVCKEEDTGDERDEPLPFGDSLGLTSVTKLFGRMGCLAAMDCFTVLDCLEGDAGSCDSRACFFGGRHTISLVGGLFLDSSPPLAIAAASEIALAVSSFLSKGTSACGGSS